MDLVSAKRHEATPIDPAVISNHHESQPICDFSVPHPVFDSRRLHYYFAELPDLLGRSPWTPWFLRRNEIWLSVGG